MENTDKQQPTQECAPCDPIPVAWFRTVNTGESRNKGVEVEAMWEPIDNLRIDGSLGYQDYLVTDLGTSAGLFIYCSGRPPRMPSIRGDVHVFAAHAQVEHGFWHPVRVHRG